MSYSTRKWIALAAAGAAAACSALAHGASNGAGVVVYRWVDDHGVVHYGDQIPPQYAQKETTVLNGQGIVVGRLAAEQTAAQLAESARKQQRLQQQKQRDTFLLTTYSSVEDIEQLRDERIDQLEGQRLASEQYLANLHQRLLALQARALLFKPYDPQPRARRLPDDLAEQLVHTLNEMRAQHNALAEKDHEEAVIRQQFQADIDRYRELSKGGTSQAP